MGDMNQLLFAKSYVHLVKGPILEVGSRDYGTTQNFRSLFAQCEYVGTDMLPGKGVDLVLDLTADFPAIEQALGGKRFQTVICMSVMEHCADPFKMAHNIQALMADGGILLLSLPFVWEIHGYPDDYWRFTPNGVRRLFSGLDFETHGGKAWTSRDGECADLDAELFRTKFSSRGHRFGKLGAFAAATMKRVGLMKQVFGYRYVFPPVMLSMVGRKPVA